jgi:hypothetical protein
MTPTQQLAAELAMSKAEAQSLRDGLQALVDYCASSKFAADPMVNVQDIFLRVHEAQANATDAANAAWSNEVGPKPEAGERGWQCPQCRTPLFESQSWTNTEARSQQRMYDHWRSEHRIEEAAA